MINPICIIKSIYRTIKCGRLVSGHDFKTIKEKTPQNIPVLECTYCGKTSIAWSWESLESSK
jgi:DNA-directed RNA polymerase subunit RPC12/RpoP